MDTSIFYILGLIVTGLSAFFYKVKTKKQIELSTTPRRINNLEIHLSVRPNANRIKIEILSVALLSFVIPLAQSLFTDILIPWSVYPFVTAIMLLIWTSIFLIFNNRRLTIDGNAITIFSMMKNFEKTILWEEIKQVKYLHQTDRILFFGTKPWPILEAKLMHFKEKEIEQILRIVASRIGKKVELNYW